MKEGLVTAGAMGDDADANKAAATPADEAELTPEQQAKKVIYPSGQHDHVANTYVCLAALTELRSSPLQRLAPTAMPVVRQRMWLRLIIALPSTNVLAEHP